MSVPWWAWLALVAIGAAVWVVLAVAWRERCGRGRAYAKRLNSSRVDP
jgi:hypothetical protein